MQACMTSNKTILLQFKRDTAIKQLNYKHDSQCSWIATSRNKTGFRHIRGIMYALQIDVRGL